MDTDLSPRARRALDALAILLLVATAIVAVRRLTSGDCQYMVWSDRDLARSDVAFVALPTTGPELSTGTGSRIPGGAFHLLLWIAGQVSPGPHAAWVLQVGLDAVAALLLAVSARARAGWTAAAVTASVFLAFGPNVINQQPLWNPAWLSLFGVGATLGWVRVVSDRDARGLVLWAVSVALGAQMHVTALVLGAVMVPSLVRARPRGAGRLWALAATGALLTYAPYLIDELRHGLPNTHRMLDGAGGHGWIVLPYTLSVLTAVQAIAGARPLDLLVQQGPAWPLRVLAAAAPLLVLAGVWIVARDRDGRHAEARRVGLPLGVFVVALLLLICTTDELDFVRSNNSRYLVVLAAPVAWGAGLAADAVVRAAGRRGALLAVGIAAALFASLGERLVAADTFSVVARATRTCNDTIAWLHDAARQQGTTEADIAGRTVVLMQGGPRGWVREAAMPVEALLRGQGQAFPGSRRPPCLAILPNTGPNQKAGTPIALADLQGALGPDTTVASVGAQVPLGGDVSMVQYTPSSLRCPTNMTQRYLLTPEERITEQLAAQTPPGGALRLESPPGTARWVARVDAAAGRFNPPWDVLALVEARREGERLVLTLHSNQLRGHAWNAGFFRDARVRSPGIGAFAADGSLLGLLPLAEGVVGADGALTPLSESVVWPPGASLRLFLDLEPSAVGNAGQHPGPTQSVQIVLPGGAP